MNVWEPNMFFLQATNHAGNANLSVWVCSLSSQESPSLLESVESRRSYPYDHYTISDQMLNDLA